jgi:large exoprotein involved in heme utilization and adhesion
MTQFSNWNIRLDGQIVHNSSNIAIIYANEIDRNSIIQEGIGLINKKLAEDNINTNEKVFLNKNIEKYNNLLTRSIGSLETSSTKALLFVD